MKKTFRAWYKGDIELGKPLLFEQKEIDFSLYFVMAVDSEFKYPFEIPFKDDDDWILEQSIGKKDKNDVDIYEGDLVIYDYTHYRDKEEPIVGAVVYIAECGAYGLADPSDMQVVMWIGDLDVESKLEVIGNIHQKKN